MEAGIGVRDALDDVVVEEEPLKTGSWCIPWHLQKLVLQEIWMKRYWDQIFYSI